MGNTQRPGQEEDSHIYPFVKDEGPKRGDMPFNVFSGEMNLILNGYG